MFKKVSELLEAGGISKEAATELDLEISKALSTLRDENAGLRHKYNELNSTFKEVSESKSTLEEQLKGIDEKILKAKEEGKAEVVKSLEAEKKDKQELAAKLHDLENKSKELRVENALQKELSKYELINYEVIAEYLKNRVEEKEGNFYLGDKILLEGIKDYFDNNSSLLKSKGQSGSGGENNGSGNTPKTLTEIHLAKLKEIKGK